MSKNIANELTFDVRVLQHRKRRGEITQEQYQAYLAKLPDDSAEGAETETRFVSPFAQRGTVSRESDTSSED